VASPPLHRYCLQAEDIVRWLGSVSFRAGQFQRKAFIGR
jgi:hypothetical protein